jgi:DNA-binding transcriptional LysR family regulator
MADLPQTRWIANRITAGEAESPVRVNDAEGIVRALQQGIGKSLLPSVISDSVEGLTRLEDAVPPLAREIWLLTPPEPARPASHTSRLGLVELRSEATHESAKVRARE